MPVSHRGVGKTFWERVTHDCSYLFFLLELHSSRDGKQAMGNDEHSPHCMTTWFIWKWVHAFPVLCFVFFRQERWLKSHKFSAKRERGVGPDRYGVRSVPQIWCNSGFYTGGVYMQGGYLAANLEKIIRNQYAASVWTNCWNMTIFVFWPWCIRCCGTGQNSIDPDDFFLLLSESNLLYCWLLPLSFQIFFQVINCWLII